MERHECSICGKSQILSVFPGGGGEWWGCVDVNCEGNSDRKYSRLLNFKEERKMVRRMTLEDRQRTIKAIFEKLCLPVLERKGKSSMGGTNEASAFFRQIACPEQGHTHYRVLWDLWQKQLFRMRDWIMTGNEPAEGLDEMIRDIVNYGLILGAMMHEDGLMPIPDYDWTTVSVKVKE